MRIGVTTNDFNHSGGGMERQAFDIAEGLVGRGVATVVFARKANVDMPIVSRLDRLVIYASRWIPGKLRDKFFSWRVDRGRRGLGLDCLVSCSRIENADVVVCGGTHIGYLRSRNRKPRIYDNLYILMERKQFSRAACIAACSRFIRDEIIDLYGVDATKVPIVYPAIDAGRFAPCGADRKRELRERYGFARDKKTFLFPSYSHERKGLPFLLRFFGDTDLPVELVVVGRRVKAGGNVRSFGPTREIELLYQAADATVMASSYEPFGMAGVESVLCGTPAILTENMGCCEVLDEPGAYKIARNDVGALERAVRRIVDGGSGEGDLRRFIRYDFSRKAYMDSLMRIIGEFPG